MFMTFSNVRFRKSPVSHFFESDYKVSKSYRVYRFFSATKNVSFLNRTKIQTFVTLKKRKMYNIVIRIRKMCIFAVRFSSERKKHGVSRIKLH